MTLQTTTSITQCATKEASRAADFETEAMPYSRDLYRTALRMLQDSGKAGDAVQETYLLAWKSFDRYERGTNCKAWLYQILFNVVRHERRTWFKWITGREEDAADAVLVATPSIPTELGDQDILAALDRIPSQFRDVVLLVDVEEFSYKETSEMLKVPIGTVMSRLSRGRGLLREELAGVAKSYGIGLKAERMVAQ
jgi:RNA polymerase sigma-70 factor, ECF subfamily